MRTNSTASGVAVATLLAGPVFMTILALTIVAKDGVTSDIVSNLLLFLLVSVPFGAIAAILPNVLGSRLLAAAGQANVAFRLPVMWLLAGAAAGAMIGMAFANANGAGDGPIALMAAVGAIEASLCRLFTRWDD